MALWTPADLSPTAWWDASIASSLTLSSGYVDEWRDISGNDYHASNSGTDRPYLESEVINGKNAISFSSPQHLDISSVIPAGSSTMCCHVFTRDSPSINSMLIGYSAAYCYSLWWAASTNYMWTRIGATAIQLGSTADVSSGTFLLVTERTTTPQERGWLNGESKGARSGSSTLGAFNTLGRTYDNNSYQHNGHMAEIILFTASAVSSDDRQKIEGYLAWKWGIMLPGTHPYYSAAPTTPDEFIPRVLTPVYDNSSLLAAALGL